MAKVIVLGGGIGGISASYELRSLLGNKAEVTVVSDSAWFQFVPSNPWVALNWRKPEDIKIHLPEVLARFGIGFEAGGAKHILAAENSIELNDGRRLAYDYLILRRGGGPRSRRQQHLDLPCRSRRRSGDALGGVLP